MRKYSSCHFGDIQISRNSDYLWKEMLSRLYGITWYYFGSKIRKSDYNEDICRIEFELCVTVRFLFFSFLWVDSMRIRYPFAMLLRLISIGWWIWWRGRDLFHYNCGWILNLLMMACLFWKPLSGERIFISRFIDFIPLPWNQGGTNSVDRAPLKILSLDKK